MGYGDHIMAVGAAKDAHERTGHRIWLGEYQPLHKGFPFIASEWSHDTLYVPHCKEDRPYLLKADRDRLYYDHTYRVKPGAVIVRKRPHEAGYVVIEPGAKRRNKQWPVDRWQAVADKVDNVVELGTSPRLKGVRHIRTNTIHDAIDVLSGASLLITTDGALHHAAAALGVRAVVLWGGFSSPDVLGYDAHTNIWDGDKPCGNLKKCPHCTAKMAAITPADVLEAL